MEKGIVKSSTKLSREQIQAIETALSGDKRVEVIPTKEGVKLYLSNRVEIKTGATAERR